MNRRTILALIFSICLLFLWQAIHSFGPIKFRGGYPLVSEAAIASQLDTYNQYASVCNDLPSCFRPLSSWIILTVHHTVSRLFVYLGKLPHFFSFHEGQYTYYRAIDFESFPISVASQIVLTIAYVASFSLLIFHFGGWLGFVAAGAFGLVPLAGFVGLTEGDGLKLLYWSCFITFLARTLTSPHCRALIRIYSGTGAALIGFLWGIVGSLLMYNVGVAVSIALFCVALYCMKINLSDHARMWWIMYGSSTIGTLATLGALWMAGHRHPDLTWGGAGSDPLYLWTAYSHYDQITLLLKYVGRVFFFPTIVGALALFYLFLKRPRRGKTQRQNTLLPALATFFGVACTVIAGFWLGAGYRAEWPRQLLPLALCYTWLVFSAIRIFIGRYTRAPQNTPNP